MKTLYVFLFKVCGGRVWKGVGFTVHKGTRKAERSPVPQVIRDGRGRDG